MDHKEKLKTLLSELFRLDQKDLDFGIYRVMRARADEIQGFLDENLLKHIHEELKSIPAQSERLEAEREVYEHLYRFFRRYYSEGDFISQRIYREGTYAIPYSGEEVMLHWANKDQYYIKSTEALHNYSFVIMVGAQERKIHFKLVDIEEGEHGNVKPTSGKERRFMLLSQSLKDMKKELHEGIDLELEGDELTVRFAYRKDRSTQKNLDANILATLLNYEQVIDFGLSEDVLKRHIDQYVTSNTFDFFIHKDLGGFLTRELDHFVKTEVLELDDIEKLEDSVLSRKLSRVRALRVVAGKLITFLASLEDFQKKLWLKKKFVVETNYCITLDLIPEELYPEIATNEAQIDEWVRLFAIDEIKGDLHFPAFSRPLNINFLKNNQGLLIDTHFFSTSFRDRLTDFFVKMDDLNDGVLINSENAHALSLIQNKCKDKIKTIYIDPPYNTSASEIIYKNSYKHSSWLSLINSPLTIANSLLNSMEGVLCATIDDFEYKELCHLIESKFHGESSTLAIRIKPSGRPIPNGFALSHEYAIFAKKNPKYAIQRLPHNKAQLARYSEIDEKGQFFWEMFRKAGSNSNRNDRPTMYYPFYLNIETERLRIPELTFDDKAQEYVVNEALNEKEIAVYPIKDDGSDGRWYFGLTRALGIVEDFSAKRQTDGSYRVYYKRRPNEGVQPTTLWFDSKYSATEHGTALLKDIFGEKDTFSYPKSIHAVIDCLSVTGVMTNMDCTVLDYFAGSGTTGHAVVSLNRKDHGKRKYILVEMGNHFTDVLKPRMKKIIYASDWSKGKPASRDTSISHCFKYIRLESYEDTLNNLELKRTDDQTDSLKEADLYEEYMLSYLFDQEAEGNALLSTSAFKNPTAYTLNIKRPGGEETVETTVDLIETFNWLIGLRVHHMRAPITTHGWHRLITGELPNGMKVLIIWRKLTDDITDDNIKLNQLFVQEVSAEQRAELDVIYVNGSCDLDSVKTPEEHWKVELLDEHFTRLMFDTSDVEG